MTPKSNLGLQNCTSPTAMVRQPLWSLSCAHGCFRAAFGLLHALLHGSVGLVCTGGCQQGIVAMSQLCFNGVVSKYPCGRTQTKYLICSVRSTFHRLTHAPQGDGGTGASVADTLTPAQKHTIAICHRSLQRAPFDGGHSHRLKSVEMQTSAECRSVSIIHATYKPVLQPNKGSPVVWEPIPMGQVL